MSTAITDKTFVILMIGGVRIYINPKEAEIVKQFKIADKVKDVAIGDRLLTLSAIAAVLPASDIEALDRTKRGDWKCKYDFWHERNQQCAHTKSEGRGY